ncbi:hypothetical protein EJ05DRAFT_392091 [Pseudovirgaria hyperparasitica]|uniref:Uncharacterized protein n=1 Tax=Pseudovirgaria hyperparasitica TaxID=470096 RepID=A0A6A6W5Q4_9PEZI|nr:uncharacterized protein EJ05DRAFT_392091 [Pseudovirgaria hyperparasitica]KAF2757499.1 hypothetical protein EJ05DRAFT_392091 [Pseudovirgaria hyperparasitica]
MTTNGTVHTEELDDMVPLQREDVPPIKRRFPFKKLIPKGIRKWWSISVNGIKKKINPPIRFEMEPSTPDLNTALDRETARNTAANTAIPPVTPPSPEVAEEEHLSQTHEDSADTAGQNTTQSQEEGDLQEPDVQRSTTDTTEAGPSETPMSGEDLLRSVSQEYRRHSSHLSISNPNSRRESLATSPGSFPSPDVGSSSNDDQWTHTDTTNTNSGSPVSPMDPVTPSTSNASRPPRRHSDELPRPSQDFFDEPESKPVKPVGKSTFVPRTQSPE